MQINDLKNGQVVRARVGRPGPESVTWEDWKSTSLYVQRDSSGEIVIITPADGSWAEYGPRDWDKYYKLFLVGDYYFQIEGLG